MVLLDDKQVEALEASRATEEQLNVRGFYFFLFFICLPPPFPPAPQKSFSGKP